MTTQAIIFNGPPGQGKDECCRYLKERYGDQIHHMEMKTKLFDLTCCIYDYPLNEFLSNYQNREWKETPNLRLDGLTPRQALIHVQEDIIKPNFGKFYFGNSASKRMMVDKVNVFSDGGFEEEIVPIHKACDGNMMIIQIHRPGHDYSGDSRNYIHGSLIKDHFHVYRLQNDSTLEKLFSQVDVLYRLQQKEIEDDEICSNI